jgi:hypothetical protein
MRSLTVLDSAQSDPQYAIEFALGLLVSIARKEWDARVEAVRLVYTQMSNTTSAASSYLDIQSSTISNRGKKIVVKVCRCSVSRSIRSAYRVRWQHRRALHILSFK